MLRDFNDLQFFVAVVQHHGVWAGARALGLPKSRVSRRVAILEERLGVRLLDRTTRGIKLTEVGQQVFAHARGALAEAEAAEDAALRMQSEPRGLPLPPLAFAVAVAAELGGGLLLIAGYQARAVAAALALFSLATAFAFHADFADQNQMIHFLKNVMMAGGLLQIAAFGAGAFSLDNRRGIDSPVPKAALTA